MKIACPTCEIETEWSTDNKYRPFCSERCRLIDLGEWFNEERKISDKMEVAPLNHLAILSEADLQLLSED